MAMNLVADGALRRERGSRFRYDRAGHVAAIADLAVVTGASLVCGAACGFLRDGAFAFMPDSAGLGILFAVLFVLLMQIRGLYRPVALLRPLWQVSNALAFWIAITAFLTALGFAFKAGHMVSRAATISFVLIGFALVAALRFRWHGWMRRALQNGKFATRRIALVADAETLDRSALAQKLAPYGLSVAASFRLPPEVGREPAALAAALAGAVARLRGSAIDEVVVALGPGRFALAEQVVAGLRILPLPVRLVLDPQLGDLVMRPSQRFARDVVAVEMHRAPMSVAERALKRGLDLALAGTVLLLIAPLLLLVALAIRLDSPGPVLFRQTRNGFNNRPFRILKFRSMRVMENGDSIRQASRHDERVTRVGRWLRRLSIDELPQLWNVLRGEMSIVGPRPHALAHDSHYEKLIGDYPYRQHVKPGLTGWAQVNGSRGETPTIDSMAERVRLDLWYVENASLWLDLRIIARTVTTLLDLKHSY
ncbi:undecaprenyl-phosphate glucose phosphotransferase [Bosea minatitlanensis]|uniref:Undecaprenyl-phosphate glucose phosphotransferase n=1 Tax=Bosea minatitlanensis TaxID=128782 RepID=A0ABW0F1K4_9HYPH|nr:undecaprenyl-phosphate glucose phosphotransferase [Bosea minatitlanensis]MCT4491731.1 undecaprenyl-phosphate glucose phosphotransferase [Bosea minatitlanensis]